MVSTVDDVVEILFSFPLVIKNCVAGVMKLKIGDALPTIGFPFVAAIAEHDTSDAIARMLSLALGL